MKKLWTIFLLLVLILPQPAKAADDALAEVDGVAITSAEVEKSLAGQLSNLEEQIYNLKRQKVDALINDKLLEKKAAKRKVTVPQLLDAEVTSKVTLVTEQEVEKFYQDNKAQIKSDDPQIRDRIRAFLQNQKLVTRREEFVASLRSQAKVVVNLKPPPAIRAEVSSEGAPVRGTAEAARCAEDQGKFWDYYDVLFKESPKLSPDDLKRYAAQVGIDVQKFDACVSEGVHKATVQKDLDEGTRLGITGTPAFFINGRSLTGAQPLEAFARIIDEELARNIGAQSGTR